MQKDLTNTKPETRAGAKEAAGKPRISLVPPQIIKDIAEVRENGIKKYKDPENWRGVPPELFLDAFLRHVLAFMEDPQAVDKESGIKHYKHAACGLAFLCAQWEEEG